MDAHIVAADILEHGQQLLHGVNDAGAVAVQRLQGKADAAFFGAARKLLQAGDSQLPFAGSLCRGQGVALAAPCIQGTRQHHGTQCGTRLQAVGQVLHGGGAYIGIKARKIASCPHGGAQRNLQPAGAHLIAQGRAYGGLRHRQLQRGKAHFGCLGRQTAAGVGQP